MQTDGDSGGRDPQVEEVLAAWFLAVDEGRRPDLAELCGEDADLAARVRALLDDPPHLVRAVLGPTLRPASSDDIDQQTRIGEFRVLEPLGRGGMGAVFLAEQESLRRKVALKILEVDRHGDDRTLLRFRREAELAAMLRHPNIVPIYGVGEAEGCAFIAMKWLTGPGLDQLGTRLTPVQVARIGAKIARALDHAHVCGIVHRDLKPSNILLDDGEPVLVDFGLARATTDTTVTRPGAVPGTLPYLAPELLSAGPAQLDPAMDVYGLGATLYELVCGRPPVATTQPERAAAQIMFRPPPPLGLGRDDRDLETIVLKALEKSPRDRFRSAAAMADELERFAAGQPIGIKPLGPWARLARLCRRRPRRAALAGAVLLVSVGSLWLAIDSGRRERLVYRQAVGGVRSLLDARRFAEALAAAEALRVVHVGDTQIDELHRRAEAAVARGNLLDGLTPSPRGLDPNHLRQLVTALRDHDAGVPPWPLEAAAIGLAHWLLGEDDLARAQLASEPAGGPAPRAAAALRNLVEAGDDDAWPLPPGPNLGPDDVALSATVVGLAGRPLSEQDAEIAVALKASEWSRRVRLVRAVLLQQRGLSRAAIDDLMLLRQERPDWRPVRRHLARAYLAIGDLDAAATELAGIPPAERLSTEAALDIELALKRRDFDTADAKIERALRELERGRWPAAPAVQRAAAQRLADAGATDAALEQFDRVAREAPSRFDRELALADAYRLRAERAATQVVDAQRRAGRDAARWEDTIRVLRPVCKRGEALLQRLVMPRARGWVAWKLGMLRFDLRQVAEWREHLDEAVERLPNHWGVRRDDVSSLLLYADRFRALAWPAGPPDGMQAYLEKRAASAARALMDLMQSAAAITPADDIAATMTVVAEAARRTQDWELEQQALRLWLGALHRDAPEADHLRASLRRLTSRRRAVLRPPR
ncbi:MAG: serine/threonine-protein kinase [Planctomycetota bacterium]